MPVVVVVVVVVIVVVLVVVVVVAVVDCSADGLQSRGLISSNNGLMLWEEF